MLNWENILGTCCILFSTFILMDLADQQKYSVLVSLSRRNLTPAECESVLTSSFYWRLLR
jgi:hypothetical protein